MNNVSSRALIVLGVLLALGMSLAAFLLGTQVKQIGGGRQSITVKGLAEKPVRADIAEWSVGSAVIGATRAEALAKLREAQAKLRQFLVTKGFTAEQVKDQAELISDHFEQEETRDGRSRTVLRGFDATQRLTLTSNDLPRIDATAKAMVEFQAEGNPVVFDAPLYLVSTLEAVKMSLIGAATQNARARAEEFAKNGGITVGAMRSASQGAFYILPAGADNEVSDYSGVYDKSSVDKLARVVVTIEYGIEK